ncbi:hypothetical protein [Pontibacter beigongshangensis]|uniref:hypothetical protein n=1 Tax=Pontibacter beigongshangensis TaxID=2574733 RepID=UPI00164FD45B|nr:hypothetical protein [Pontibacter beigongshangensis]
MKPTTRLLIFLMALPTACTNDNLDELSLDPGPCDTTAVTYSATVRPILAANCYSCHSSADPSGGVVLDTHAGVSQPAGSGKLLGVISHAPGFVPMPQSGGKLSDCNITKIRQWIEAGAPDN